MRRYGRALILFVFAIEFLMVPFSSHPVFAAGNLYISPVSTAALPVGSSFSVLVKVAGMDQFNGWEIQVVSDPSVISPTSISTAGNIFQSNTTGGLGIEARNCVNGFGSACCLTNACLPLDGAGIADSALGDTKLASGNGLLFNVTFKVVSSKPFSPITIQNDVLSNGGQSDVVHSTSNGFYGSPGPVSSITVSTFFTGGDFNPLVLDGNRQPGVNILLVDAVVKSTNPGQILAWVNITNMGQTTLQSLMMNDTLPVDWAIHPPWIPSAGAIHIYYANTTSLATNLDITDPSTIATSTGNPQIVSLAIPNLNNTGIGHPLLPGQSILLSVMLKYGLKDTSQTFTSYPRSYTDTALAAAWTGASYAQTQTTATGSASFIAHARPLGDLRGDGKVDIYDVGLVLGAYGSTPGSPHWLPAADFDNDGYIGTDDVNMILSNYDYGTGY